MDPQLAVLRPYADYLEDCGLDRHSAMVIRDGGFFTVGDQRWMPVMDGWTRLSVNLLLNPPRQPFAAIIQTI